MKFEDIKEAVEFGLDKNGKLTAFGVKNNPNISGKKMLVNYEVLPGNKKKLTKAVYSFLKSKGKLKEFEKNDLTDEDIVAKADGSVQLTSDNGEKFTISAKQLEKFYK